MSTFTIRQWVTFIALGLAPFTRSRSTDGVEVTPSSGTIDVPPYAQSQTQVFQVKNIGDRTVDFSIHAADCQPFEMSCAWSTFSLNGVAPNQSVPLVVTFTSGAPGWTGTISFVAKVNDNQSISASANVTVRVPQQAWVETKALNPGTTTDRDYCVALPVATNAAYECGDLRIAHATPSLRVREDDRTPLMLYNSAHAEPRPVVLADVSTPAAGTIANVNATLTVRRGNSDIQVASQAVGSLPAASTRRIALSYDAQGDTTGIYPYTMTVSMTVDGQPQAPISTTDTLVVVNRRSSPFGAGWWMAGYERLTPLADSSLLWVGGDGSTRRFVPDPNRPGAFGALSLDRPDTLVLEGSLYVRKLRHRARVEFDLGGKHVATRDPLGMATVMEHDGAARLQAIVHPAAAQPRHRFFYGGNGLLDSVTAAGPTGGTRRISIVHGAAGRIDQIVDPDGKPVGFTHTTSASALINGRTNRNNITQSFEFASNRLVQATMPLNDAESAVSTFCPVEIRGLATEGCGSAPLQPSDAVTTIDGPRHSTDVNDVTTVKTDRFGAPAIVTDPFGNSTRLFRGRRDLPQLVTRVVHKNGWVNDAFYDGLGLITALIEFAPFGPGRDGVTLYQWDSNWERIAQITYPEGNVVRFAYNPTTGNRMWQEDGRGVPSRVDFAYNGSTGDGALLLASVTAPPNAQGQRAVDALTYDSLGNVDRARTAVGTPDSGVTRFVRDGAGRVTLSAILINQSGAERRETTAYDLVDRVTDTKTYGPALNTATAETLFVRRTYDDEGNLRKVERWSYPDVPGSPIGIIATRTGYDFGNRVVADTAPVDGSVEQRIYDRAGNVVSLTTRREAVISMTYDAMNRLLSRTLPAMTYLERRQGIYFIAGATNNQPRPPSNIGYPRRNLSPAGRFIVSGDTETFAYDAMGNTIRAANSAAIIRRSYYANGLLSDEVDSVATYAGGAFGQHVYPLHYDYDLNRRRTRLVLPPSLTQSPVAGTKNIVASAYDPASGLLSSVTDPLGNIFAYSYDGPGQIVSLVMPGGIAQGIRYDLAGRLAIDSMTNSPAGGGNRFTEALLRRVRLRYDARGSLDSAFNSVGKRDTLVALRSGLGHLVRSIYSDHGNAFFAPPFGGPGRYSSEERFAYDGLANIVADTMTYTGRVNNAWQTISGSRTRLYQAGTGRLKRISKLGVSVDSLFHNSGGDVEFATTQAFNTATGNPPVQDRASYFDAADRLRAIDYRRSQAFLGGPNALYRIVFEFEEFRYDALGRRVLHRVQRSCNPPALQDDACRLSFINRVVWDGSHQAMEIRQPGDSAASAAVLENDGGPAPVLAVYQGTNGEWVDPNAFFGRVAYANGALLDAPLSVTRWEYADTLARDVGAPNGYQRWTEPFTIVPHWTSRGAPDNGSFADGGKVRCGGGGIPSRCVTIAWPFGFSAYRQQTFRPLSWHGSLLEDNRDASGLLYRRNRYVDPNTGQFTQEDPIGLTGGLNLYGFGGGDPVNFSDPFGLQPCPNCRNELSSRAVDEEMKFQQALTPRDRVVLLGVAGLAAAGGAAVAAGTADMVASYAVARFAPVGVTIGKGTEMVIEKLRRAGPAMEERGAVVTAYLRSLPGQQQALLHRLPNGAQVMTGGTGQRARSYVFHPDGSTTVWALNVQTNAYDMIARITPK